MKLYELQGHMKKDIINSNINVSTLISRTITYLTCKLLKEKEDASRDEYRRLADVLNKDINSLIFGRLYYYVFNTTSFINELVALSKNSPIQHAETKYNVSHNNTSNGLIIGKCIWYFKTMLISMFVKGLNSMDDLDNVECYDTFIDIVKNFDYLNFDSDNIKHNIIDSGNVWIKDITSTLMRAAIEEHMYNRLFEPNTTLMHFVEHLENLDIIEIVIHYYWKHKLTIDILK